MISKAGATRYSDGAGVEDEGEGVGKFPLGRDGRGWPGGADRKAVEDEPFLRDECFGPSGTGCHGEIESPLGEAKGRVISSGRWIGMMTLRKEKGDNVTDQGLRG